MNATMASEVLAEEHFDEADLAALQAGIRTVLAERCGSLDLHAFLDRKLTLDRIIWEEAAGLGWFAVGIPEVFGGLGLGIRGLQILHQELGRHCVPGPYVATLAAARALASASSEPVVANVLERVATGELRIAVPAGTAESAGAAKNAPLLGDSDSPLAVVPVDGGWALVDLAATGSDLNMWDLTRCVFAAESGAGTVLARLPDRVGSDLAEAMALAIAIESVAGARAIAEQTVEYLKQRKQFDRIVASYQALKHRAADLFMRITTCEKIVQQAVDLAAQGSADAGAWAALAKAEAVDCYTFVSEDCVQLHGGVGFTWEFDVHIHLKRARLNEMLVAPNYIMRDRAADGLARAALAGRSTLELPTS